MATLAVRLERCYRNEAARLGLAVDSARRAYDDERRSAVEALIETIDAHPETHARRLQQTPEGVSITIDAWRDLGEDLAEREAWGVVHRERAENLMGRRPLDLPKSRMYVLSQALWHDFSEMDPADVAGLDNRGKYEHARREMLGLIEARVRDLTAYRETLDLGRPSGPGPAPRIGPSSTSRPGRSSPANTRRRPNGACSGPSANSARSRRSRRRSAKLGSRPGLARGWVRLCRRAWPRRPGRPRSARGGRGRPRARSWGLRGRSRCVAGGGWGHPERSGRRRDGRMSFATASIRGGCDRGARRGDAGPFRSRIFPSPLMDQIAAVGRRGAGISGLAGGVSLLIEGGPGHTLGATRRRVGSGPGRSRRSRFRSPRSPRA